MYRVEKTFGHDLGLSCAFRQWRTDKHCRYIHGYALSFTLAVEARELDSCNWAFDFGGFERVRNLLKEAFDHKTCAAADDPELPLFRQMERAGVIRLLIMDKVGCEAFAEFVYRAVAPIIEHRTSGRASLVSVTVREHGANSVTFTPIP